MHKRKLFFPLMLCCFWGQAQNQLHMQEWENNLLTISAQITSTEVVGDKDKANASFIKTLSKALHEPYSFNYPFNALKKVSHIYAPDSSFRIFSWQIIYGDGQYRKFGAIQMNSKDGALKLYPLFDVSAFSTNPSDSVRTANNWIGAVYYKIILKQYNNQNYYTLLGYDANNELSTKKWIEVLTFDSKNEPVFGGNFFDYHPEKIKPKPPVYRFSLEYKKDAGVRLSYNTTKDMIVFDHLIYENDIPTNGYTNLIPDGDYEGFKWQKGKWVQVVKVDDFKLNDSEAPTPHPLSDKEDIFQGMQ